MGAVIGHPEGAVSSGMVLLYAALAKGRDRREDNSSPRARVRPMFVG